MSCKVLLEIFWDRGLATALDTATSDLHRQKAVVSGLPWT